MTAARFHHVAVGIPGGSETEAREFYGGLLGLKEIEKPEPLKARGGLWLESAEGVQIHLQVGETNRGRTRQHFALVVEDSEGLQRKLEAAGHETTDDPNFPGFRRFYVNDLWGNMIEILSPTGR